MMDTTQAVHITSLFRWTFQFTEANTIYVMLKLSQITKTLTISSDVGEGGGINILYHVVFTVGWSSINKSNYFCTDDNR